MTITTAPEETIEHAPSEALIAHRPVARPLPASKVPVPRPLPTADRAGHRKILVGRHNIVDLILVATVIVGSAALVMTNILGSPAYQDDEGTYTAEAESVQNGNLAPYTYWYDHPPFGWIQLGILGALTRALGLGDGTDIGATRFAIALFFVANATLIYLISRRLTVRPVFSFLAPAIFVLSPISLASGRQVYLDCIAMPWLLLAFYLAISPRRSLWSHAGAGAAFAIAVLSKLTAAIMGPALLFAMLDRAKWRSRYFSVVAFLTIGALLLTLFPLMAMLRGELFSGPGHVSLQDGLIYQFASREGSGFVWETGSSRFELAASWLAGDTFLVVGGLIGGAICLASRRTRWLLVAIVSFLLPVTIGEGYLPAMYIIGGIPFLCLAIGAGGDIVWRGILRIGLRGRVGWRRVLRSFAAALLAFGLVAAPTATWAERDARLLTVNENAEWTKTLEWVRENVPRDDVVVVPFSIWQDLHDAGWDDPWSLIALEKVDLDTSFKEHHPGGWQDIDWVVVGPSVKPNLGYLDLPEASKAYENSVTVVSFGPWSVRKVGSGE